MPTTVALGALLAAAAALAVARLVVRWVRSEPGARAARWRLGLLVAAQPLCAGLLYLLLPSSEGPVGGTLVVATRGAGAITALSGGRLVALPEAPPLAGAERVPDLATALRRYRPARLRVVGDGLPARDREGVDASIDFAPGAPPRGIVRLDPPPPVAAGAVFAVGGQVAGVDRATVELIDPAGRRVAAAVPDAAGNFVVTGTARDAGPAAFTARVRAGAATVEAATVPVWVEPAAALRVLLLAGAPGPEVKFLRRWASDAGLAVHAEVATGQGLDIGDAPLPLTAATLARFDVAVVDLRRWAALSPGARAAFAAAVRGGLGLVVRIDAPVTEPARGALRSLGVALAGGDSTEPVTLPDAGGDDTRLARAGPGSHDAPTALNRAAAVPPLSRWNARVATPGLAALLRDARGSPVAVWRAAGQGRVGVWLLADASRLVLAGRGDAFGDLWQATFATLARGRAHGTAALAAPARVGQRGVVCGVGEGTTIRAPDGTSTVLRTDRASGCAAFWPPVAGWYRTSPAAPGDAPTLFAVAPTDALPHAVARADRVATATLAARSPVARPLAVAPRGAWPWFVGWLTATATLWWFERSRRGRAAA